MKTRKFRFIAYSMSCLLIAVVAIALAMVSAIGSSSPQAFAMPLTGTPTPTPVSTSSVDGSTYVTPGALSMQPSPATQPTGVALNGTNQGEVFTVPISVNDDTGSGAGWDLTISLTAFTNSGHTLSSSAAQINSQPTIAKNSKLQIIIHTRRVIAVEVNLPGQQVEQLSANGIQVGGSDNYEILKVGLSNTGTTLLKATGSLKVIDSQDKLLQNLPLSLDSFLPGTSITYPIYVQKTALGVGTYHANLMLQYGHGQVLNYSTTFTITDQQISQIFNNNSSLSFPGRGNSLLSKLSLLQLIGLAFVVLLIAILTVFYWTKKLYRVTVQVAQSNKQNKAKKL